MIRIFFAFIAVLFIVCSLPPAPVEKETLPSFFKVFERQDSVCLFQAFGETKFMANGRRLGAPIEVKWKSDKEFKVEFYSPFGGVVASIAPERTGYWNISAGESSIKKLPRDNVEIAGGLLKYPFSYARFMQFMMGKFPDISVFKKPPDSLAIDKKNIVCFWKNDSIGENVFNVSATISRKHSSVTDVVYREEKSSSWELSYSSFIDGAPKEIRCSDPNNYFYCTYERTYRRYGNEECRKER